MIPNYMYAADIHNVANGAPSITEAEDGIIDNLTKGSLSVIARGITSAFNTIPAATNWLGVTDIPEWQTEDLIRNFDDDLAAYYSRNQETVDVIGDVVASFVPGMAAIKGLNYAQKGLSGINRGSAGRNLLQSFGALPSAGERIIAEHAAQMTASGNTFNAINSSVFKAFGTNYAQQALEMGVYELAASATMSDFSPVFADHTYKDILANAAYGGGIIGAGIFGTIAGVQTYGAVKKVRNAVDQALQPFRTIKDAPEGVDDWVNILTWKGQLDAPPVLTTDAEKKAWERTSAALDLEIKKTAIKMAGGDTELGVTLANAIKQIPDQDAAWAALLQLKELGRGAMPTKIGDKIAAANVANSILKDASLIEKLSVKEVALLNEKAAYLKKGAEKFLHLQGDDALKVTHTAPVAPKLADFYTESELLKELQKRAAKQPAVGNEWSPVGKNYLDAEARYIIAFDRKFEENALIHSDDLPNLEAALASPTQSVIVNGVAMDKAALRVHIKAKKEEHALEMYKDSLIDPDANTDRMARALNVKRSFLEGGGKNTANDSDYFALTTAQEFRAPSVVRLGYDAGGISAGVSGDVLSGMVKLKHAQQLQARENALAAAKALGPAELAKLPVLTDRLILSANSGGAGAGLLTFSSGEYGTLAATMEYIGKTVNRLKIEGQKYINDTLQPHAIKVIQNSKAANELAVIRQAVMSTGEHYVLKDGEIVLKAVAAWEAKVAAGAKDLAAPAPIKGVPERIAIETQEAKDFLAQWVKLGDEQLAKVDAMKAAVGKKGPSYGGVLYFPQHSSKQFTHFSFVVPKSTTLLGDEQKVQMIWAKNAEELAAMEAKVPGDFRILHKSDTDAYYKAMQEYDYHQGMNSLDIKTELGRRGVAADFFPASDPQKILQEMLEYRHKQSDKIIRDGVSLNYSNQFSELKRLDAEYKGIQTSTKKSGKVDSPYESYVKTALDIPRTNHLLWSEFNNLAENSFSLLVGKVREVFRKEKSPAALEETAKVMDDHGFRGIRDAVTQLLADSPADKKELSKFVLGMNGAMSTLMLRTDPMNALVNSMQVLLGSETSSLIRTIKGLGKNAESALLREAYVGVPGGQIQQLSPTKLISGAYKDWVDLLAKKPEAKAWESLYDGNGWLPSMLEQQRSVADAATLTGLETSSKIGAKTKAIWENTSEILEKVTFNKSVEEMNRFVAARVAHKLSDIAVKNGGMTTQEQLAFINTFINRTQGNYLASQRPLMFQGPVGHAISLFQTYSFNMMQHLFRFIENGDKKQAAILMGLQGGMYGLNGLPAFEFLNRHLVGEASGNVNNQDVSSFLMRGGDVGQWLLYGGLSNATGLGLYSRGDLNPRNATILASSLNEIPFVNATRNFFGALSQSASDISAGANVGSTLLRGIEHAGLSRPLAGLAANLQGLGNDEQLGYSVSGKNQLMATWDMYSLASVTRALGARPLEEAITRDSYHRVQVYDAHRSQEINQIGSAIRDAVRGKKTLEQDQYDDFITKYVHAGGDQKNFIKFFQKQVKDADRSQVDLLVSRANTPYSKYMQVMMGAEE